MLRAAVGMVAYQDVEAIAQAAEEAVPGDIDDDMAIVVVQSLAGRPGHLGGAPSRPSRSRCRRPAGRPCTR